MNQNHAHILLICPGFAKDESDTACLSAIQEYLLEFKLIHPYVKFTIIALQYPYVKSTYQWHGIKVYSLNASKLGLGKKLIHWGRTIRLAKLINQSDPIDLVHSFWLHEAYFVASRISKSLKLSLIASGGGQEVKTGNRYLKNFKNSTCTYVCSSKTQQALLKSNYGISSELIPMGLRSDFAHPKAEKTIDILGVGNFTKNKDYLSFVRIVQALKQDFPELKVMLVGDGEQRQTIESEIAQHQLESTIQLTGMISREFVYQYMSRSKILLHPSEYESFGMAYIEALAHGMYVVSKKTGIAESGDKWSVFKTNEEASNMIHQILSDSPDFTPQSPYPSSKMVNSYFDLYKKLSL